MDGRVCFPIHNFEFTHRKYFIQKINTGIGATRRNRRVANQPRQGRNLCSFISQIISKLRQERHIPPAARRCRSYGAGDFFATLNYKYSAPLALGFVSMLPELPPVSHLHHFTHPLWFERAGGFRNLDNRKYFERYLAYLLPKIAPLVSGWNVINEFNLAGGYSPANDGGPYKFNLLRYHALGYHLIHHYSNAPVSTAHAYIHWFPRRFNDPLDRTMTQYADFITNEFFFHAIRTGELVYPGLKAERDPDVKGAMDFWSVNYYTRHMVDGRLPWLDGPRFKHKQLKLIPMDFYLEEFYPEGLIANLERLTDRPVYITENGCAATDDRFRIVYLALTLSALSEALERGVDVRGYFYWSLLDNYEWGSFIPKFGLVAVDPETFARTPKPSADFYREVIARNGFDSALVRRFLPELPTLAPALAAA